MTLAEFRRVCPTAAFTVSSGKLFTYRYYQNPQAKATLVLLTGGIGLSDLFYKHFARFARDFSVLTFDYQLQFGDNGEFADAVAELLRHLKEKVWLVGQSLGGVVAQVIASRHPEVVEGLVLSNTCSLSGNMSKAGYQDLMKIIESQRKFKKMACLPAVSAHQADDEMGGDEKENRWLYSPGKGRYGGTVRRYDGTAHQAL
ncbi:MAG: alpha/beta fold hydrolase [Clostridia bacterium]